MPQEYRNIHAVTFGVGIFLIMFGVPVLVVGESAWGGFAIFVGAVFVTVGAIGLKRTNSSRRAD